MLLWKIHSTSGSYTFQLIDLIFSNMHSHSNLATLGFPDSSEGKELLQSRRPESSLWVGKIPWRREEQPTPGLLPGESMDRPWGYKESDATERLTFTYCPALTGILTSSVASSHLVFFSPLASILYHSSPLKILLSLHLLFDLMKWSVIIQPCLTLCNPIDGSPQGSSVHGVLQARVLEWVATYFSRGFSQHRHWTQVSALQANSLLSEPTEKSLFDLIDSNIFLSLCIF